MAKQIKILGQRARRGERMTKGKGSRLAMEKGRERVFIGRANPQGDYFFV